MTHLSPEELIDLAEAVGTSHPHLDECAECREQVAELRTMLVEARLDDAPEPAELFWRRLSDRIHEAIASDDRFSRSSRRWVWPTLGAAAAAVLLAVAGARFVGRFSPELPAAPPAMERVRTAEGPSGPDLDVESLDDDASWLLMADLTAQSDDESSDEELMISGNAADHALSYLSEGERQSLGELLEDALSGRDRDPS